MKKLSIIALLALISFPAAAQQLSAGDQYMANEVAAKAIRIRQLADENEGLKAALTKAEAELAKLKTPTPKQP